MISIRKIRGIITQAIGCINRAMGQRNRNQYGLDIEQFQRYKEDLDNCIRNGSCIDDNGVERKPKIIITGMHDL